MIRLILPKITGLLKLISYWMKRVLKAASVCMKGSPKNPIGHMNGFSKAAANKKTSQKIVYLSSL
jgi:hypothetical protein